MATLAELTTTIFGPTGSDGIVQDASFYASATTRINAAVTAVAGGLRMPDGQFSPPMPDLFDTDTVTTSITLPSVSLPSDYQRSVIMVADSNGNQLHGPRGGDYYTFRLFLKYADDKALAQAGAISTVCVNGTRLYYQGIPSAAKTLTVLFYREPVAMASGTMSPDGLPSHLSERLIKHYVCKEIYGEIEDGDNSQGTGFKHHLNEFYKAMTDLMNFLPEDGEPQYYSGGDYQDLGVCD